MKINKSTGLFEEVTYSDSPHCDARPDPTDISLLVVHSISLPPGEFGGDFIPQLFAGTLNPNDHPYFETIAPLKVSAHILIDREGVLTQFVPFCKRAWHAGVSSYEDRECCNDYSIGVELEGTEELAYTQAQYEALAKLTMAIQLAYPKITADRITGHSDIAPGRKTDPGQSFDWKRYYALMP
jgi:AmpD protein